MDTTGPITLLPPALTIAIALGTHRVLPALALGALTAAWVATGGDLLATPGRAGRYLFEAATSVDNLSIATFTLLVAVMVALLDASGGMSRLVGGLRRLARGPRGAALTSWLAGFVVFFDDYANCLVVGASMGPVCDANGVSRAKLAYIVDSTAAPVASLTLVGTWVGYEVSQLDLALAGLGRAGEGYALFVASLPYAFYSVLALVLVGVVAITGRDLGPMLAEEREAAQRRARSGDDVADVAVTPLGQALQAASPVVVLVGVTLVALLRDGLAAHGGSLAGVAWHEVLADADPYRAMLWGALAGALVASLVAARWGLGGRAQVAAAGRGAVGVAEALAVLALAWTAAGGIRDTGADDYLLSALDGRLGAAWLPVSTFLVAAATSFATGTSFGTMGILLPLVVPLAAGLDGGFALVPTVGAVLSGAIFGDHASPISDTTVLSATGAGTDLVTHVRTQLPYALLAGGVAVGVGYIPAGFGVSPWLSLAVGTALLVGALRVFGQPALTPR